MSVIAQSRIGKVSGQVIDESQKPVEGATVSLLKGKDAALVKVAEGAQQAS